MAWSSTKCSADGQCRARRRKEESERRRLSNLTGCPIVEPLARSAGPLVPRLAAWCAPYLAGAVIDSAQTTSSLPLFHGLSGPSRRTVWNRTVAPVPARRTHLVRSCARAPESALALPKRRPSRAWSSCAHGLSRQASTAASERVGWSASRWHAPRSPAALLSKPLPARLRGAHRGQTRRGEEDYHGALFSDRQAARQFR